VKPNDDRVDKIDLLASRRRAGVVAACWSSGEATTPLVNSTSAQRLRVSQECYSLDSNFGVCHFLRKSLYYKG
jgi:hypothetical protein